AVSPSHTLSRRTVMTRYVVPVVVLVALVGGYGIGQQPTVNAREQLVQERAPVLTKEPPVGRFLPLQGGMMLDTANGLLLLPGRRGPGIAICRSWTGRRSRATAGAACLG